MSTSISRVIVGDTNLMMTLRNVNKNEVTVCVIYPSTAHVKDAVKQWSTLTLHREFMIVMSSPRIYEVHYKKDDCAFRVSAYKGKWDHYLEVKEMLPHTCTLDRIDARRRNISADFVEIHMYPTIVKCTSYELKAINSAIDKTFGYIISYGKAYHEKKKVLEHRWGTYDASYHNFA
jgi:hypothetical protein